LNFPYIACICAGEGFSVGAPAPGRRCKHRYFGMFMTTVHHEILAACPPERVWALLADLEAVQHYTRACATRPSQALYARRRASGHGSSSLATGR
jgi:hypothetical protein